MPVFSVEKLGRHHDTDNFDCGVDSLNDFLSRYAFQNQRANASQTYVGLADGVIVGFYTLVFSSVSYDDAPERLKKGLARYPVPLMVLARLAVIKEWQSKGVGTGLLKDAILRTLRAADIAGLRALVVHAKNDEVRQFYDRFGFIPSPSDQLHLHYLIKDLKKIMGE